MRRSHSHWGLVEAGVYSTQTSKGRVPALRAEAQGRPGVHWRSLNLAMVEVGESVLKWPGD